MTTSNTILETNSRSWEAGEKNSHILTGIFFIIVGAAALARSFMVPMPEWLFTWQTLLITIGLFIGIRNRFHGAAWFILIITGSVFLLNDFYFLGSLRKQVWPLIAIAVGAMFILKPRKNKWERKTREMNPVAGNIEDGFADITILFGSTKKKIESKRFAGGDITSIFGGAELDLSNADMQGEIMIDITTLFGGVELIIPSNWTIKSEVVSVFGSVKDKRIPQATITEYPEKIIILDGTAIFGGIEIRSFKK
ncbi:MAG: hypothetical protein JSS70_16400 [Bacteroidetes bacterium]|nr:hypothetical protein [Bacteroidota bacterium]